MSAKAAIRRRQTKGELHGLGRRKRVRLARVPQKKPGFSMRMVIQDPIGIHTVRIPSRYGGRGIRLTHGREQLGRRPPRQPTLLNDNSSRLPDAKTANRVRRHKTRSAWDRRADCDAAVGFNAIQALDSKADVAVDGARDRGSRQWVVAGMADLLERWTTRYPLVSIEDGPAERLGTKLTPSHRSATSPGPTPAPLRPRPIQQRRSPVPAPAAASADTPNPPR